MAKASTSAKPTKKTAANRQVREEGSRLAADNAGARVLVSEVATITRSLAGIAATRDLTSS